MKCRIGTCNQEVVVAGPPSARHCGMCWPHAVGLADALAEASPATLARETGVLPVLREKEAGEVSQLAERVRAVTGGATLRKLGGF